MDKIASNGFQPSPSKILSHSVRRCLAGIALLCSLGGPLAASAQETVPTLGVGAITSSVRGAQTAAFQEMLQTQLIKTNKFKIIERAQLDQVLGEKGLGAAGITGNGGGKITGVQGVDYLVYGAVTKLGVEQQSIGLGGFGTASKKASMAVDLRVVDAHTGEIRYANTVEEQVDAAGGVQVGGFAFGNTAADPLADVQRLVAKSITGVITTSIYPIKVIAVQSDGTVVVNYGDAVLTVGDTLKLFIVGERFVDPDTKKVLGAEEVLTGTLRVSEVTPTFSKARVTDGKVAVGNIAKRISSAAAGNGGADTRTGATLP